MNTTDLNNLKCAQLVDQVRALQEDTGKVVSAASTLLRLKKPALIEMIEALSAEGPVATDEESLIVDYVALHEAGPSTPVESQFVGTVDSTAPLTPAEVAEWQQAIDEEGIDPEDAPAAPQPPRKRVGAAPTVADAMVITVLAPSNPRRPGTAGYKRFALLQTGMTVGAFVEAVKLATHNSDRYARGTLNKAVRLGHVRVDPPAA
jgi:hypothetical protein